MADTNTGGAAFPNQKLRKNGDDGCGMYAFDEGMTLRDYFAAKVLQGLMANSHIANVNGLHSNLDLINAKSCYAMADAMLEARKA